VDIEAVACVHNLQYRFSTDVSADITISGKLLYIYLQFLVQRKIFLNHSDLLALMIPLLYNCTCSQRVKLNETQNL